MRKFVNVLAIFVMLFVLTGCGSKDGELTFTTKSNETSKQNNVTNTTNKESEEIKVDYKSAAEKQMALPEEGETVAIIKVKNFGEMKVKFFKEIAPKAVENFVTHAKNGYYNGVTFHRIINEFMIQGGDPTATGTGGESIWGEGFGAELSRELVPYRGSLCMAMSSLPNSIGSQFFITQANYASDWDSYLKQSGYPNELIEQYKQYGGYMSLYMNYTVFGQVYEGLDVLDAIAKVETGTVPLIINGMNYGTQEDKPLEDVIIETIEVTTYSAK